MVYGFLRWEGRLEAAAVGNPDALQPLVRPSMLRNRQLTGGLGMFFAQFMIQAGAFFAVPLFLSVVLGLNAAADRRPAGAAVDRAAGDRDRHPQAVAEGEPAAGGPDRPAAC